MTTAGMIIFSFTVLLSCVLSGEFDAFLVSVVSIGSIFFIMKAKSIHQWSLFDVMNGAKSIDPKTHLIAHPLPVIALFICIVITVAFYILAVKLVEKGSIVSNLYFIISPHEQKFFLTLETSVKL